MADNFPGPYEVRIFYTVNFFEHVQKLSCNLVADPDPGDPFDEIDVYESDGSSNPLDASVDSWVALLLPLMSSADAEINRAELWKITPLSYDGSYISSYDISEAGTSGSGYVVAAEMIFTFRTINGGIMKIHIEEGVTLPGQSAVLGDIGANHQALANYVTGSTGWMWARDNSYASVFLKLHPGQNEAVFKKRYRS